MTVQKLLVIAAHPDDEVLGCGATMALRRSQGWETHVLIAATGITGRASLEQASADDPAIGKLRQEMEAAHALLGVTSAKALDFPDNRLDTVSRMDLAHAFKETIEQVRPGVIMTHHPGDYNWDHTRVFDAVMMAARSSPGEFAPSEICAFEVASSTERAWQSGGRVFQPNFYVDVEATIEVKKRALAAYATEVREYPHPRSPEGIEILAAKRGSDVGRRFCEAFELIRKVEA